MEDAMQPVVEQRGYAGTRTSPFGIGATIAVHAAAVGVFLMLPKEVIETVLPGPFITHAIPLDLPPPPPKENRQEDKKPLQHEQTQKPFARDPIITNATDNILKGGDIVLPPVGDGGNGVMIDPPSDPVLTDALPDPKAMRDFQPTYPPSMQRAQAEGKVTVRVRVGADGRVLAVEKLFATNDAFWEVTERQALRKWRFRPATRDGVPVEGVKIMTVHFKLDE
jgi:protein TonB